MSRGEVKVARTGDERARKAALKKRMTSLMKKAKELTILCNLSACLIFFSRNDNNLVVWPSHEEAKSLIKRFYLLTDNERNKEESYLKTTMKMFEKKIADSQEVIKELEMDHIMFQIHNGRRLVDLSQNEIDKLISYSNKKITCLRKELDSKQSVNVPSMVVETPKAPIVAFQWGRTGFRSMERGSMYLFDKWFADDFKVLKHYCNETILPPMSSAKFDLNLEPSDDEDNNVKIYKGESSNIGCVDNA